MAEAAKSATSENFMVSACCVFVRALWLDKLDFLFWIGAVRLRDEVNVVSNDVLTLSKRWL